MSLLVLDNIVKEYKNKTVLNGVSLSVERGEKLALIGPNGSGKSTLIKIAMGFEKCDGGSVITAKNIKIGYLSQSIGDIDDTESSHTALDVEGVIRLENQIKEMESQMAHLTGQKANEQRDILSRYSKLVSAYEAMDGYNVEVKIKKILKGLMLRDEALTLPLSKLSGGEKMRVSIAKMLLDEPDLLILDEPTNHLDIQAIEWLEEFIRKFEGGVLVVSHDRYFLDHAVTRIVELLNGSVVSRAGNYTNFINQKKIMGDYSLKENKRLVREIKNQKQIALKLKGMGNISGWKSREIVVKKREGMLKDLNDSKIKEHLFRTAKPALSFADVDHTSKDIAEISGLTKKFGKVDIFKSASFTISGGERIGIIGPNGCGKTTLIKILLGMDNDYEGHVRLGEWVKYSYVGQEITFEDESRTMVEEILSKKEMTYSESLDYLSKFQFYGDDASKKICVLSGGERVRLYLACIMLEDKNCLIMDEPTNHLDISAREALENALKKFKGTLIAITHDRYFLNNCITRILEISCCKINSYDGNYENYRHMKLREYVLNTTDKKHVKSLRPKVRSIIKPDKDKENTLKPEQIESQIIYLEQKAKEIEQSFECSSSAEIYYEYSRLQKEIEKLYSLWDNSE